MKKFIAVFAVVLSAAVVLPGQDWTKAWAKWHGQSRLSMGFTGGVLLRGALSRGRSFYQDSWDALDLNLVSESADLNIARKSGYAAGFSLEYFLTPGIGLQVLIGCQSRPLESSSVTGFSWYWRDGRHDSRTSAWTGSSSLVTIPVAMNGMIRLFDSSFLSVLLSGGLVLHFNELRETSSTIVWGFTRLSAETKQQYVDALAVPIRIGKTRWTGLGGDAGLSCEVPLGSALRLVLETRYYLLAEKTLSWTPVPVEGDGLYFSTPFPIMRGVSFDASNAADIVDGNHLSKITLNPSIVQIAIGLKWRLGP